MKGKSVVKITQVSVVKKIPTHCFICGKELDREKWREDYCFCHENLIPVTFCSSPFDHGALVSLEFNGSFYFNLFDFDDILDFD